MLCLQALDYNRRGFLVCEPIRRMFRSNLQSLGVKLPPHVDKDQGQRGAYSLEEILDTCMRVSYLQPSEGLAVKVSEDFVREWREANGMTGPSSDTSSLPSSRDRMRLDEVLNE